MLDYIALESTKMPQDGHLFNEKDIHKSLTEIREEKHFFDLTFVCNEGQIDAHQILMAAASPVFKEMLLRSKYPHPVIYLRGISLEDMEHIMEFVYTSKVNISTDKIYSFLEVAKDLKIEGISEALQGEYDIIRTLTDIQGEEEHIEGGKKENPSNKSLGESEPIVNDYSIKLESHTRSSDSISESKKIEYALETLNQFMGGDASNPTESQTRKQRQYDGYFQPANPGDTLEAIRAAKTSLIESTGDSSGKFKCKECDYRSNHSGHLMEHVENHINHGGYKCTLCGKEKRKEIQIRRHFSAHHKQHMIL